MARSLLGFLVAGSIASMLLTSAPVSATEVQKGLPVGSMVQLLKRIDVSACRNAKDIGIRFQNGTPGGCYVLSHKDLQLWLEAGKQFVQRGCVLVFRRANIGPSIEPTSFQVRGYDTSDKVLRIELSPDSTIGCFRASIDPRSAPMDLESIQYNLGSSFKLIPKK